MIRTKRHEVPHRNCNRRRSVRIKPQTTTSAVVEFITKRNLTCRVPTFFIPSNSLTFPWFPKSFPWFFLSFHQDILVKKNIFILFKCGLSDISLCKYCNFLTAPDVNSLKKHFPQIYRFKRFENSLEKSSLIWNFFPDFGWKTPVFPDWKKSSKFSLNSLIDGNPGLVVKSFYENTWPVDLRLS